DGHGCLTVKWQPVVMETGELRGIVSQRPYRRVLHTAPPEFVERSVQEYRGPGPQQLPVLRLREGSTAKGYHGIAYEAIALNSVAPERFRQIAKGAGFGQPKRGLPAVPKNLGNGLSLTRLDSGIQIHKIPVQPPGKFLPHAALARSHESYKKHRAHSHGTPSRS